MSTGTITLTIRRWVHGKEAMVSYDMEERLLNESIVPRAMLLDEVLCRLEHDISSFVDGEA